MVAAGGALRETAVKGERAREGGSCASRRGVGRAPQVQAVTSETSVTAGPVPWEPAGVRRGPVLAAPGRELHDVVNRMP